MKISDTIVDANRSADFLCLQQPQSRFEIPNRISVSNRNVAFLLEGDMKVCYMCKKEKSLSEFNKQNHSADGYDGRCKKCQAIYKHSYYSLHKDKKREQIKRFYAKKPYYYHYNSAKQRCVGDTAYTRKGRKFLLTLEEVKTLWFRDKAYLLKQPSIDRKDNDGNYTFDNCRFIERLENCRLGGLLAKGTAVKQFDLDGNLINRWVKISYASRELGVQVSTIVAVCRGRYKTAGGYKWEYA